VARAEALWVRILGVLVILVGMTLFFSPQIDYTWREKIPHARFTVKREKVIVFARPAAALIVGAGVVLLIFARKSSPPT
jgi:hypothetical protein